MQYKNGMGLTAVNAVQERYGSHCSNFHTTPDYPTKLLRNLPKCVKNHGKLGVELLMLLYALNPKLRAGIAQSAKRLATGWTARGSNPGGGRDFSTRPDMPEGQTSLLYNGYRVFPGGKAAGAFR